MISSAQDDSIERKYRWGVLAITAVPTMLLFGYQFFAWSHSFSATAQQTIQSYNDLNFTTPKVVKQVPDFYGTGHGDCQPVEIPDNYFPETSVTIEDETPWSWNYVGSMQHLALYQSKPIDERNSLSSKFEQFQTSKIVASLVEDVITILREKDKTYNDLSSKEANDHMLILHTLYKPAEDTCWDLVRNVLL